LSMDQAGQLRAKTCGNSQANITEDDVNLILARFNESGFVSGINKIGAQQDIKTVTGTDQFVLADVLNRMYIVEQQSKSNELASKASFDVNVELLKSMLRAG